MPDNQPVRIDVVSDVVCPWCFIGKHRLYLIAVAFAKSSSVHCIIRCTSPMNGWVGAV